MSLHINRGNIISRIGRLRRHRFWACIVAGVAIIVAIDGWMRPMPINKTVTADDCQQWCINNGDD